MKIIKINNIKECLDKYNLSFPINSAAGYLYSKILEFNDLEARFDDSFIKLAYATLDAWGMNGRAARLKDFKLFREILLNNKATFLKLGIEQIDSCQLEDEAIKSTLKDLFIGLQDICVQKSKLVTISKTMHFFLPCLIPPIDRRYTLRYFAKGENSIDVPAGESSFALFMTIIRCFQDFARLNNEELKEFMDLHNGWNKYMPKLIDSIIVGLVKNREEKK